MDRWPVQIYAVTDDHAQELIVGLLSGIEHLVAQPATRGADRYVIVECADRRQANLVRRLIGAIDVDATVLRAGTTDPAEPVAV